MFYNITIIKRLLACCVIVGAVAIATSSKNTITICGDKANYYNVIGSFFSVKGIDVGSDIRVSGTKIGSVCGVSLADDYNVNVTLTLQRGIDIPYDSAFVITTNDFGETKHIDVSLGGQYDMLADGDVAEYTQGSIDILSLVNNLVTTAEKNINAKK